MSLSDQQIDQIRAARHMPTLEYDGHGNMDKATPTCSCGWRGKTTRNYVEALRQCREHKIASDLARPL